MELAMKVVVTGSSGVVGSALCSSLVASGHSVVRLVRRPPTSSSEVRWHPELGGAPDDDLVAALAGVDAAVNLAGAGIGDHRWTAAYKRLLLTSRVDATTALVTALSRLDPLPTVLVSGSAYGFYGETGDIPTDETGARGDTFLAGVSQAWEQAADAAADAGIRVAMARTGLVVSPTGGAFGTLIPLVKLGLGGRLGSGQQWWPFISLRDEVAAISWLLTSSDASGAYNLTAPEPCTNLAATQAMGHLLHRPTLTYTPRFALRALLGEFADELLVSSRIVPGRLQAAGFVFQDPTVTDAVATLAAADTTDPAA
jgi:uncharacterized protein (TIGR01777 family)